MAQTAEKFLETAEKLQQAVERLFEAYKLAESVDGIHTDNDFSGAATANPNRPDYAQVQDIPGGTGTTGTGLVEVVKGRLFTRSDYINGITMIRQLRKLVENEIVVRGDYRDTINKIIDRE